MEFDLQTYLEMPKAARTAVHLTVAAWCWFLVTVYGVYDPQALFKFAAAGAILCTFLVMGRNWARVLSLLACVFIVVYCGFFTLLFSTNDRPAAAMSALNVVLFATAFFFLVKPETAAFFREKSPPPGEASG